MGNRKKRTSAFKPTLKKGMEYITSNTENEASNKRAYQPSPTRGEETRKRSRLALTDSDKSWQNNLLNTVNNFEDKDKTKVVDDGNVFEKDASHLEDENTGVNSGEAEDENTGVNSGEAEDENTGEIKNVVSDKEITPVKTQIESSSTSDTIDLTRNVAPEFIPSSSKIPDEFDLVIGSTTNFLEAGPSNEPVGLSRESSFLRAADALTLDDTELEDDDDSDSSAKKFCENKLQLLKAQYRRTTSATSSRKSQEERLLALLEEINKAETLDPQDRVGTPENLIPTLMEHQVIGLTWLIKKEESTNHGGILADEMGLGKTIQSMALILARPSQNNTRKPTLVVTPVSLMHQWAHEFETKTRGLSVFVHHGKNRLSSNKKSQKYDVVITSYPTVAAEFESRSAPLIKTKWHRVILDEAQSIKNQKTKAAKACCSIDSLYRWCLSGTPIQNNIEELYSLIKFLRIEPYCDWKEFRQDFIKPFSTRNHYANELMTKRLHVVLKSILLRRNKNTTINGKPIIVLPPRDVQIANTEFTPDEREFYTALETKSRLTFSRYLKDGSVMRNYSNILLLLLRLRQACCHPYLIKDRHETEGDGENSSQVSLEDIFTKLSEDIVTRLKEQNLDQKECPICYDSAVDLSIIVGCGHSYCRECLDSLESKSKKGKGKAKAEDEYRYKLPSIIPEIENWVPSTKIERTISLIKEFKSKAPSDKTIIFSQFTTFLDLVAFQLHENDFKFARYDGKMDTYQRNAAIKAFEQQNDLNILLVSLKCGGVGLNLTVANQVIMLDPWWNPAMENQAIDRVHRIGQTKPVEVHRIIIPNTIEQKILDLQEKKQQLASKALGEGGTAQLGRLGLQELLYLFRD
ncbi:7483_t:CDS:2 [Ambispora gerdemannii]|uniref:7483_t:CDS:1 n=1 Tax=Ambispora gerdemannii TaxID=144530 RepID=A0A9N9BWD2_9GLOM|nr:7483_t:CDS:2 [Ambispora gerdemannii]